MWLINEWSSKIRKLSIDTNVISKSMNEEVAQGNQICEVAAQQAFIVTEEVAGNPARFISKLGELECIRRSFPRQILEERRL